MRRQPGEVIQSYADGIEIRYSPTLGASVRYRVTCPHGRAYYARTQAGARETADDMRHGDCPECARLHRKEVTP